MQKIQQTRRFDHKIKRVHNSPTWIFSFCPKFGPNRRVPQLGQNRKQVVAPGRPGNFSPSDPALVVFALMGHTLLIGL